MPIPPLPLVGAQARHILLNKFPLSKHVFDLKKNWKLTAMNNTILQLMIGEQNLKTLITRLLIAVALPDFLS